jgi:hypothetical protein
MAISGDPAAAALVALRQMPAGERYERGKDLIKLVVEFCLKNPARAALIEEVAVLCGKSIVAAQDIRSAVEKTALDWRPAAPVRPPGSVQINMAAYEFQRQQWGWGPERWGAYDPFSRQAMWGDDDE